MTVTKILHVNYTTVISLVHTHSTQELPYFGHNIQKHWDLDSHGHHAERHHRRDYLNYTFLDQTVSTTVTKSNDVY
jgi:hypothetical protein